MNTSAPPPWEAETWRALRRIGVLLGHRYSYLHRRSYHFSLCDGLTIALTPETAGRFRVDLCEWRKPIGTLWTLADDPARLAEVVLRLVSEAERVRDGV